MKNLSLYLMIALYIIAGVMHFRNPKFYLRSMPSYIPANMHQFCVSFSGVAEVVLGLALLIPACRPWAAWGIILLLIAVFPSNVYMLTSGKFSRIPEWLLILRLPLQGVLVWWAYQFTQNV